MTLTDALKKPNATPVYLLEVTAGDVLKRWLSVDIPAAPANLTASAVSATAIDLDWDAATGATSYSVYRGTSTGSYSLIASGITDTDYSDTGLTANTEYFYVVSATAGGGEGAQSAEVSQATIVTAPANLILTTVSTTAIDLDWDTVTGADTYSVYRGTSTGVLSLVASGLATNSYSDTGLTAATEYFYAVTATNEAGESAQSTEASATTSLSTILDSFTRASLGSTDTGETWAGSTANYTCNGTQLRRSGATAATSIHVDKGAGYEDVHVTVLLTTGSGLDNKGPIARKSDDNNKWTVYNSGGNIAIEKKVAGVNTFVQVAAGTKAGTDTIGIKCVGNTITSTKNGVDMGSTTDAFNNTATQVGVIIFSQNDTLDNFSAVPL